MFIHVSRVCMYKYIFTSCTRTHKPDSGGPVPCPAAVYIYMMQSEKPSPKHTNPHTQRFDIYKSVPSRANMCNYFSFFYLRSMRPGFVAGGIRGGQTSMWTTAYHPCLNINHGHGGLSLCVAHTHTSYSPLNRPVTHGERCSASNPVPAKRASTNACSLCHCVCVCVFRTIIAVTLDHPLSAAVSAKSGCIK